MITVKTFYGSESHPDGSKFRVDEHDGSLLVYDSLMVCIALYAGGHWSSVVVEPKKD
jgi:hypothetical protein